MWVGETVAQRTQAGDPVTSRPRSRLPDAGHQLYLQDDAPANSEVQKYRSTEARKHGNSALMDVDALAQPAFPAFTTQR